MGICGAFFIIFPWVSIGKSWENENLNMATFWGEAGKIDEHGPVR